MIKTRRMSPLRLLYWGTPVAGVGAAWAAAVYLLYAYAGLSFIRIPFLPVATIGTAVAFYVGFKNKRTHNQRSPFNLDFHLAVPACCAQDRPVPARRWHRWHSPPAGLRRPGTPTSPC